MKSDHWKRSISAILATGLIILTTTVPLTQVARAGIATPSLVPCTTNCGVSTTVAGPYTLTEVSTVLITLPAKDAPQWGTTVANIPTLFAYNILLNFETNANLDAMVSGMDQFMLARLSTELYAHDASNYTPSILAYAAEKLSGLNLRRLEASFGPALMASAMEYAPAATLAAYNTYSPWANPLSETWWQSGAGAGVTDSPGQLYLYDVFLDSYTAGAGGSTNPAIKDMERYMGARVKFVQEVIVVSAILGAVAAVFAILDSPTAQQLATSIGDWVSLQVILPVLADMPPGPLVITWPAPISPPAPDPTIPTLPPIEGDPGISYDVSCSDGTDVCLD